MTKELDLVKVPRELMDRMRLELRHWHDRLLSNGDRPGAVQVAEVIFELR
jgi:hypothetical protein